jgi:hypothetical protein
MDERLSLADQAFVNALAALVVPVVRGEGDQSQAEGLVRRARAAGVNGAHPRLVALVESWERYEAAPTAWSRDGARMALRDHLGEVFRRRAMLALARAEGDAAA